MNECTLKNVNNSFDIISRYPTFNAKHMNSLFMKFNKLNILKKNGVIILHRHKNENDQSIAESIGDYINHDGYLIKDILEIFDDLYKNT